MHKYVKCKRVVCSITEISNGGIPIRSGASPGFLYCETTNDFQQGTKILFYNDCLGISIFTVKKIEILSLLWKVNF